MPIACRSYLIAGPPEAARILAITRRQTPAVQRRCGLIGVPLSPPSPGMPCQESRRGDARGTRSGGYHTPLHACTLPLREHVLLPVRSFCRFINRGSIRRLEAGCAGVHYKEERDPPIGIH